VTGAHDVAEPDPGALDLARTTSAADLLDELVQLPQA